jgi:dsDNA-binding SOS-regulon protein
MINSIEELNLQPNDTIEVIDAKVKEKLNIFINDLKESLSNYLKYNSEKVCQEVANIAPNGDYSKLLETPEQMSSFLQQEASKPENWELHSILDCETNTSLIQFVFYNLSIDDGDVCRGNVFVSKSGKIRHAFAQIG